MHMHVIDGTVLVILATACVAFERIGTAVILAGIGTWLLMH